MVLLMRRGRRKTKLDAEEEETLLETLLEVDNRSVLLHVCTYGVRESGDIRGARSEMPTRRKKKGVFRYRNGFSGAATKPRRCALNKRMKSTSRNIAQWSRSSLLLMRSRKLVLAFSITTIARK